MKFYNVIINNKLAADAGFTPDVTGDWSVVATLNPLADVTRTVTVTAAGGGGNTAPTITFSLSLISPYCILTGASDAEINARLATLDAAAIYADAETTLPNLTISAPTGSTTAEIQAGGNNVSFTRTYQVMDDDTSPLTTIVNVDLLTRNNYNGACAGQPE